MNQKIEAKKTSLLAKLGAQYAGEITPVALSILSAWLIVTGVRGLAGFTITQHSAFADLIGIVIVVSVARWMNARQPRD